MSRVPVSQTIGSHERVGDRVITQSLAVIIHGAQRELANWAPLTQFGIPVTTLDDNILPRNMFTDLLELFVKSIFLGVSGCSGRSIDLDDGQIVRIRSDAHGHNPITDRIVPQQRLGQTTIQNHCDTIFMFCTATVYDRVAFLRDKLTNASPPRFAYSQSTDTETFHLTL